VVAEVFASDVFDRALLATSEFDRCNAIAERCPRLRERSVVAHVGAQRGQEGNEPPLGCSVLSKPLDNGLRLVREFKRLRLQGALPRPRRRDRSWGQRCRSCPRASCCPSKRDTAEMARPGTAFVLPGRCGATFANCRKGSAAPSGARRGR